MRINVPNTMADVTLGQYQEFEAMRLKTENETELILKTIEIFCGIPNAREIDIESVGRIEKHLTEMLTEQPQLRPIHDKLGFVPNLTDITMGELIDLDKYLGDVATWHKAMAVLYRPLTHRHRDKYAIEPYKGTQGVDRRQLPLDVAMGAVVFFWTIAKHLVSDTLPFLGAEMETAMTLLQRPTLQGVGVGIRPFSGSQVVTS